MMMISALTMSVELLLAAPTYALIQPGRPTKIDEVAPEWLRQFSRDPAGRMAHRGWNRALSGDL